LADKHVSTGIFRLFLAFSVFSTHVYLQPIPPDWGSGLGGVTLFFIVSGFIIADVLDTVYRGRPGAFLLNRATRLYPPLWATLLFATAILFITQKDVLNHMSIRDWTLWDAISTMLIVPAYPLDRWGPLPNGWTLTIEAQFYVVAAATVFLLPRRRDALRIAGWVALAIYSIVMMSFRFLPFNPIFFIPFFVLGAAIYRGRSDVGDTQDHCQAIVAFVLTICSIETFGYHFAQTPTLPRNLLDVVRDGTLAETLRRTGPWIAFYLTLFVTFLLLMRVPFKGWLRKLDIAAGDLTYPFYLIHIPVVSWMLYPSPIWSRPQFTFFVYVMCGVAAYGLHRAVERPMAALRRRIRDGVTEPVEPSPHRQA
jgi:peptidoglycan/LPS O-acetylase OafA/YrhL